MPKRKRIIKRRAECCGCGFITKLYRCNPSCGERSRNPDAEPNFLCVLCEHVGDKGLTDPVQRTVRFVGNAILAALREPKPE